MLHSRCQWVCTTQPRPATLRPLLDTLVLPLVSRQKTSEVQKMMPSWHTMPSLSELPLGTLVQMSSAQALAGTNGFMITFPTSTSRARRLPSLASAIPVHILIICDATGELYECFTKQGAEIIGSTSADDGFDYTESKGVVDGKFVGQVFDEDNYYDASEERATAWVEQLKGEGLPA